MNNDDFLFMPLMHCWQEHVQFQTDSHIHIGLNKDCRARCRYISKPSFIRKLTPNDQGSPP